MRLTSLLPLPLLALAAVFLWAPTAPPAHSSLEGLPPSEPAGLATYAIDPAHSYIGFRISHLGIVMVPGSFNEFDATITVDPEDLSTLRASTTIQAASIDTRVQRRDDHLRSADFFEVETYPTITFESAGVTVHDDGRFSLAGDLTIKDVTRRVVLTGEMTGLAQGMRGEQRIGFSARTVIDRHDFNVIWDNPGDAIIGRDVEILLEVQAIRQDG